VTRDAVRASRFLAAMAYPTFVFQNLRPLLFGLLHSFYSAPGQTYVIGLFVASICATIGLGPAEVGALYLAATVSSAATLIFVGHWIDPFAFGLGLESGMGVPTILWCLVGVELALLSSSDNIDTASGVHLT
jgi:hypothetical protein